MSTNVFTAFGLSPERPSPVARVTMMLGLPSDCEAEALTVTLPGVALLTISVHWPLELVVVVVQVPAATA